MSNDFYWKGLVITQLASWSALPFWYPSWRISAAMEANACEKKFPTVKSAWKSISTLRYKAYSGLGVTAGLQFVYPGCEAIKNASQKYMKTTDLQGEALAGGFTALAASVWKTKVLSTSSDKSGWHLPAKSYFRALHFWAIRNAVLVPCIFNGEKYIREIVSKTTQEEYPLLMDFSSIVVPAFLAAAVSHPTDLMTTLLNGDPMKQKFPNSLCAAKSLYTTRGFKGMTIGFVPRFVALSLEVALFPRFRKFYDKHLLLTSQ